MLMVLRAAIILILCLAGSAVSAQGKPKECFSKTEQKAEQIVRDGVRLREGAIGCDGRPYYQNTLPLWQQVNQKFGPQFAQQTKIREGAFRREFADDAENKLEMWNGRIVFHFRHYPLSETYCTSIKNMLQLMMKKGWVVLLKQAGAGKDEVSMDYEPCEK